MNPFKVVVVFLLAGVGVIAGLSFIVSAPVSEKIAVSENNFFKKEETDFLKKPLTGEKPLIWATDGQSSSQAPSIVSSPVLDSFSGLIKNVNEMNLFATTSFRDDENNSRINKSYSLPLPFAQSEQEMKAIEKYYGDFMEALSRANFTVEEIALMAKTDDGRLVLFEELIEDVGRKNNLNELKISFKLWHRLDERILVELKKLSPVSRTNLFHQTIIGWFDYRSKTAKRFSEEDLSADQVNQLAWQFKKEAEIHNLKFKQSLEASKEPRKLSSFFIDRAEAFTCGALVPPPFYHFGGRVLTMFPCNFGIVETISPPCGGLLFFSYPILAANPYLYKKPIIGSAVLGKSIITPPFVCPLGVCPKCILYPYEAKVIYFGTSLTP